VFQKFAKQIAVSFDGHSYMQDYPVYKNGKPFMAIFNFGMVTGSEHFSIDILLPAINLERDLNYQLETNPDSFVQYYTEQAIKYGFHIYMKGLKLMI